MFLDYLMWIAVLAKRRELTLTHPEPRVGVGNWGPMVFIEFVYCSGVGCVVFIISGWKTLTGWKYMRNSSHRILFIVDVQLIFTVNNRISLLGTYLFLDFCMGAYSKVGGSKISMLVGYIPVDIILLINCFLDATRTSIGY